VTVLSTRELEFNVEIDLCGKNTRICARRSALNSLDIRCNKAKNWQKIYIVYISKIIGLDLQKFYLI